ncbi:PP2C family protein-serine/threonine phosphatase [Streptomyces vinaceus]|uniref:PP2C family protein-serine/threonine phosphatase n=1 Tax=Streptomyces vinaceus TaxID=1960 RepID=UPI0035DBE2E5
MRTVAAILGSFREAAYDAPDLRAVAARLERRLTAEAQEIGDEELFATAVLIEYDSQAHRVTVTNQGHVEPVLISRGKVQVLTGPPALPLGLGGLTEAGPPELWQHPFTHGDVLLLVTDGLVEARDTDLPRHIHRSRRHRPLNGTGRDALRASRLTGSTILASPLPHPTRRLRARSGAGHPCSHGLLRLRQRGCRRASRRCGRWSGASHRGGSARRRLPPW